MAPTGAVLSLLDNESITFMSGGDDWARSAAPAPSAAEPGAPGLPGEGLDTPPIQVAQCEHDDNGPSHRRESGDRRRWRVHDDAVHRTRRRVPCRRHPGLQ